MKRPRLSPKDLALITSPVMIKAQVVRMRRERMSDTEVHRALSKVMATGSVRGLRPVAQRWFVDRAISRLSVLEALLKADVEYERDPESHTAKILQLVLANTIIDCGRLALAKRRLRALEGRLGAALERAKNAQERRTVRKALTEVRQTKKELMAGLARWKH